jgi:hypothetical protein
MNITKVEIEKHDCETGVNGKIYDVEYLISYSGAYDAPWINNLSSISFNGSPLAITIGADLAGDSGVYGVQLAKKEVEFISNSTSEIDGQCLLRLNYQSGQFTQNPLSNPDKFSISRTEETVEVVQDADDELITTTAQEILPAQSSSARFMITITGARSEYLWYVSADALKNYSLVNDDTVTLDGQTFAAGTLRYAGCTASKEVINGYTVINHSWQFEVKESHDLKFLNAGFWELTDGWFLGGQTRRIPDASGAPRDIQWPLDAGGQALPEGYDPVTDVVYITRPMTIEIDFDYFGFNF